MSVLVRFKKDDVNIKARIYERASRRQTCACCDERAYGILVGHYSPKKMDTGICNECLVMMVLGKVIARDTSKELFGLYNPEKLVKAVSRKRKRKRQKAKKAATNKAASKPELDIEPGLDVESNLTSVAAEPKTSEPDNTDGPIEDVLTEETDG